MDSTITARYRLTEDRMAESFRVQSRLSSKKFIVLWLAICEIVSIVCLGNTFRKLQFDHWMAWLIVPVALISLGLFLYLNFILASGRIYRPVARHLFEHVPEGSKDITWTFSGKAIEQHTNVSSVSFGWETVTRVVEVPEGFLMIRSRFLSDWIPGDAFESPVAARLFAGMAESHAKEFVLHGECRTGETERIPGDRHG